MLHSRALWRLPAVASLRPASCVALLLAAAVGMAGCGIDDGSEVECRCTEDTDLDAFPHCSEVDLSAERPEATSPLSTRIPDCPSGRRLFLREPTNPEAVLFNVRDTYQGFGPVQYMDQLTEDFLFAPDIDGLQLHLVVFQPPEGYNPDLDIDTLWAREAERRFANNLLDHKRFQRIEFVRWYDASKDQQIAYDDPLMETFIFPYELKLVEFPAADGTTPILEIRGRADVDLVTPSDENAVWLIRKWQDFRDPSSAKRSFTELRGEFSQ